MRISRFYVDHPLEQEAQFELPDAVAHHLVRVLRAPAGTALRLFNADGIECEATLCAVSKRSASVRCGQMVATITEPPIRIALYQALSKGERMDYAVQKATELGVAEIRLLNTQRVDVRLGGDRLDKRMLHWQRVAIAAAEQCGRVSVPTIHRPVEWPVEAPAKGQALVLDPETDTRLSALTPTDDVAIAVGPEGGFTADEVQRAQALGWTGLQFGPRILRTETAGPAVIAAVQARWGDL